MKKKGFTLIELLATIVLLGVLLAITYPKILEIIEKKNIEIDEQTFNLISNAADQYMNQNMNEFPKTIGVTYCISIDKLDKQNLIPVDVKKYEQKSIKIRIGKDNRNSYNIVDSCEES